MSVEYLLLFRTGIRWLLKRLFLLEGQVLGGGHDWRWGTYL